MVECFKQIQNFKTHIESALLHDIFRMDYSLRYFKPKVIFSEPGITQGISWAKNTYSTLKDHRFRGITDTIFKDFLARKWPNFNYFFTHGCKHSNPNSTSVGIFSPTSNFIFSASLNEHASISTAEITAIYISLLFIKTDRKNNYIIFSDCKSALQAIESPTFKTQFHLIFRIRELLYDMCNNFNIVLCWIPSHVSIEFNERADALAKMGRVRPEYKVKIGINDFIPILKTETWNLWRRDWNSTSSTRGRFYKTVQDGIPDLPWFRRFPIISREFVSTLVRLRFGHWLFPAHLHRINISDSPACDCGNEIGDANHIFFNCRTRNHLTISLTRKLMDLHFFPPFEISNLLYTCDIKVYSLLFKFIKEGNILV